MIDKATYDRAIAAFGAKIGKDLSPLMKDFYYAILSHDLDTVTFVQGARRLYVTMEHKAWPDPHWLTHSIAMAVAEAECGPSSSPTGTPE